MKAENTTTWVRAKTETGFKEIHLERSVRGDFLCESTRMDHHKQADAEEMPRICLGGPYLPIQADAQI